MCIGLLYAMKGEIESMLTEDTPLLQEKAGVSFYRIREDIIACCGGVGKVNAAMATQLFIDLYRPDLILNVGVAGCFEDLPIGTLVLPDRFMQHDMDTSAVGDPVGLISGIITAAASIGGYAYIVEISPTLGSLWQMLMGMALVPLENVWPTILTYSLVAGALVGGLGSMFSIRKHLNV